jgi:glutathione S-transferase
MKLYFAPNACSLAPHIILRELGLPFELVRVNNQTKRTADGRDFLLVNPKGYVAALQLEDGTVLTEGAAILQYLADQKPDAGLAPANGSVARSQLQAQLNFIGSELHAGMSPLFSSEIAEEAKAVLRAKLSKRLGYMEQVLNETGWTFGNGFSVADAYLFTVLGWAQYLDVDLTAFPAIRRFREVIGARPAVVEALRAEAESAPVQ